LIPLTSEKKHLSSMYGFEIRKGGFGFDKGRTILLNKKQYKD